MVSKQLSRGRIDQRSLVVYGSSNTVCPAVRKGYLSLSLELLERLQSGCLEATGRDLTILCVTLQCRVVHHPVIHFLVDLTVSNCKIIGCRYDLCPNVDFAFRITHVLVEK